MKSRNPIDLMYQLNTLSQNGDGIEQLALIAWELELTLV